MAKNSSTPDATYEALLQILWRRRIFPMAGAAAVGLLAMLYVLFATRIYLISSKVTVAPVKMPGVQLNNANENAPISENFLNTQAELMTATPTLALAINAPGVDELKILSKVEDRLAYLKKNVRVEVGKKVDIISVSLEASDPVEGATLVNAIVNAYINYQSSQMKKSTVEVIGVLRKELIDLNVQLENKNQALYEFRKQHNMMTLGDEKNNITMERLSRLSQELTTADVEVLNAKSAYEQASAGFKTDPGKMQRLQAMQNETPGMVAVDELSLKAAIFDLQQRLRDMSRQYMNNHPLVISARTRLDQLELSYMTLMEQKYEAAKRKRDELAQSVTAMNKEAIEQSGSAAQYTRLQMEVRGLEEMARNLDAKIKTTNLTENVGAMNITVVDEARYDERPVRPKSAQTLAIALILGFGAGVVAAFAREFTDRSLKSAADIEKSLGIAVLGAVPTMPRRYAASTHARAVHLNPASDAADAYRSLRSALVMGAGQRKFKTFLVTSPLNGDGKTTVACNMAIALAKAGSRVLLMDTNLRDPAVHTVFGLPNDRGLATILSGDTEGQTIQASGIPNLDVLAAGLLIDEPSDLLNSPLLTETMVQLSRMYDMVIVDAAPILPVADGRIVAASCDASVLVLNSKRSDDRTSIQACEGLLSVGAEVLGIIVNDVAPDRLSEGFDVSFAHLGGAKYDSGGAKASSSWSDKMRSNP